MMNLLKIGEIKSIEQVANVLDEWREGSLPSELKMVGRHAQLIVMIQKQMDDVVVALLAKMQGSGELVQKKFIELLTQAKVVDGLIETDPSAAEIEDARLRGFARQVVETLHDIAQIAKKERKRRIVKKTSHLIYTIIVGVIVGLIVAILIDIFGEFGWLERIKAFIYNILWPK